MPDELTDSRDDLIHSLVRFATVDFSLEPLPEPFDGIVLWTVWRQMFLDSPRGLGDKLLHFLALMNTAIV